MTSGGAVLRCLAAVVLLGLAACRGAGMPAPVPPPAAGEAADLQPSVMGSGGGKIKHVVVIVQENRSFDYLFHGFPGADTANAGFAHGRKVLLKPWRLDNKLDVNHTHLQFLVDYDGGKNDGFNRQIKAFDPQCPYPRNLPRCWVYWTVPPYERYAYSFAPRSEVEPYWTMASRYALGDRTFASNNGPSFPSHQFLIAGQASHVVENPASEPWGCDSDALLQATESLHYGSSHPPAFPPVVGIEKNGPFPCFSYPTIARSLDRARVTWSYYSPPIGGTVGELWSAFDADWAVRFSADWTRNVKSPETRIFNDVQNRALPSVSWVVPSLVNSDHASSGSLRGPQWVAAVVNAIGESPYWNDTIIVVMWDEWGGWYDHVVPPQYKDPRTGAYEGLGFRVPVIVISPYAKRGYVSHRQHEIASSLHLIEGLFGLPSLGQADARADAFDDMFDFSQSPAPFKPIPSAARANDFINEPPSLDPPDD